MAEHVQAALDQMVPPLRDLLDRQIFTSTELDAIVDRRRASEYLLRRTTARKADFLRYIQAEEQLEKLRKLRTAMRRRDHRQSQSSSQEINNDDNDNNNKTQQQHIGDVHILQHIHLLYVRARRKFRSDLSLHLAHVDFCKSSKSWNKLGKVYAEILQVFPRQAGVWIEAASHEFFGPTKSIRSARILLQRGLRINKSSEDLWMEYFSLELHYAQLLGARQTILQDKAMSTPDQYDIARVVYKNAIQAISDSIPFRLKFLDVCRRFPNTEELVESIHHGLQTEFASQPQAWIARAMHEAHKQNVTTKMEQAAHESVPHDDTEAPRRKIARTTDPVIPVLEEALATVDTEEMILHAFQFAQSYEEELESFNLIGQQVEVAKFLHGLVTNAEKRDLATAELAVELSGYLARSDEGERAALLLDRFCKNNKAVPATVWIRMAALEPVSSLSILKRGVQSLDLNTVDHLKVLLQYFGAKLMENTSEREQAGVDLKDDSFDTFQQILLLAPAATDMFVDEAGELVFGLESVQHAMMAFLSYMIEKSGLMGARKVYSLVLFQSSLLVDEKTVDVFRTFVDTVLSVETCVQRRKRIRKVALETFRGTSLEDFYR